MNIKNKEKKLAFKDYKDGVSTIWQLITVKYKKEIWTLVILSFFIAILDGIVPLISGKFFDTLIAVKTNTGAVWISLAILIVVTAISSFGQRWKYTKSDLVNYKIITDYHSDVAAKLVRLPMSYLNSRPMSELEQKCQRAGNNLEQMFRDVLIEILPAFLGIFVAFVTVFTINTTLSLILLAGVLAYILVILQTVGDGARLQRENQKQWVNAWIARSDGLYNIPTVKQFAAEDFETEKNRKNFTEKVFGAQFNLWKMWSKINLSQKIIVLVTQAIVLAMSVGFLKNDILSAGQVIAFNAYVGMVFGPFLRIGNMWRTIQNSIINVHDANEILSIKPEDYAKDGAITKKINGEVEFRNVTFYHDERKIILNNLNFKAEPGSVVAFVGKTGSGKTSLTELIYRFHEPKKGEVLVDGVDIGAYNLTSLRSQIGIVPQEPVLFDSTIRNNIMYPKTKVSQKILDEVARKADLLDFIKEQPDGWDTVVGDRGVKLSGGQRQRIAIARALLANPKILILDESTSALDAETQKKIEDSLKELMQGKTTFIVAHRLSAVRDANKICVLHKGKIVEEGTHEELMNIPDGRYKKLYDLQFKEAEIISAEQALED